MLPERYASMPSRGIESG